nr:hypothetical protein [Tanacetum cinerariifolium]
MEDMLLLEGTLEEGIDFLPNSTFFEQIALMGKPKRNDTHVHYPSDPTESVADEAVHKELGDRLVRAATTASSLEAEQDSGNITKTQSKATPNEPSSQGTDLGGGLRCQETIGDTIAQTRVKKLEKRNRSRTHGLKRLYKVSLSTRVESSSNEESLGEDASKKERRINVIDADEDIILFSVADNEMFDVTITTKEITLAQALEALKTSKPKDKGTKIMIEEPVKPKKKDQIRLDEEATKKLQAKFDKEERLAREKAEKVPQLSGPTKSVIDEAVHKELGDRLVRVATTASSLEAEQDSESSSNEESLGEDASKQGRRINHIDADEDITLVSAANNEMFNVDVLGEEEVFVVGKNENVFKEVVDAAQVSTAATTVTITTKEITLAQALKALKTSKPMLDEEAAKKLQAEFDEEERLTREKAEKDERANIALIKEWDDIQAKIDADHQLAKRFQAQEQEELSDAKKATLFQQLLEKRRNHFAAKRVEEKRNKPPTKAQQRKIMCTYLKNMEVCKLKDLKLKEFDSIQEMFDIAFIRVNTFEDFRTKLVEGKEKRARE